MKRVERIFILGLILFLSLGLRGYGEDVVLENIVVSATKTEIRQDETGSSTSIITSNEIKNSGKQTVKDILESMPGVSIAQTGAFGGQTSLFLRGAEPGKTLVLVDGIEVNDPISTNRSYDFAHLTTDNVERIEVVRGPQSTLYGSDAMAGVVNIVTKKGSGAPTTTVSFEGGSHETFRESVASSGSINKFNYSFSAARLDSAGISAAAGGSEKDRYANTVFSSRLGYKLFDNSELSFVLRSTDARTAIDNGAFDDDPNDVGWSRNIAAKLSFDQAVNASWHHSLSFSENDMFRKDRNETDVRHPFDSSSDWYKGDNKRVEWQHDISPAPWDTVTAGFEYERENGSSYFTSDSFFGPFTSKQDRRVVDNEGYYLQNQFKFWEKLFITPGIRVDDNRMFGAATTYKISGSYLISQTDTRLKGNFGTGFKAPSLFQLFSSYGDPGLKPDKSTGYDLGVEQGFLNKKVFMGVTYFYNDFENMVDWSPSLLKYKNLGRAKTDGFEVETKFFPVEKLKVGAHFTYTDTKDRQTGLELLRRPRHQAGLNVDWHFIPKANIDFGVNYVGRQKDIYYDAFYNSFYITDKAYAVLRVAGYFNITKNLQIFARIENLADKRYQEAYGFNTLGRSFYGGMKAEF